MPSIDVTQPLVVCRPKMIYVGSRCATGTYNCRRGSYANNGIVKTATVQADPASLAASLPRVGSVEPNSSIGVRGGVFPAFVLLHSVRYTKKAGHHQSSSSIRVRRRASNDKGQDGPQRLQKLAFDLADGSLCEASNVPRKRNNIALLLPRHTRRQIVEHRGHDRPVQIKAKLPPGFGLIAPSGRG